MSVVEAEYEGEVTAYDPMYAVATIWIEALKLSRELSAIGFYSGRFSRLPEVGDRVSVSVKRDRDGRIIGLLSARLIRDENWLERSLRTARAQVATWPEWKKKGMRVLPEPETTCARQHPPGQPLSPHLTALLNKEAYVPPPEPEVWLTPERSVKLQYRMLEILYLEEGWYDGDQGKKVKRRAAQAAGRLIEKLAHFLTPRHEIYVFPTLSGGVQVEVYDEPTCDSVDIEIWPKAHKFAVTYDEDSPILKNMDEVVEYVRKALSL